MPAVGQIIPIAVLLHDNDTTKFVRASMFDPDGAHIGGSPFSLPHKINGEYGIKTVTMPDEEFVTVQYEVFDDAGFTTKNPYHIDAFQEFVRSELSDALEELKKLSRTGEMIAETDEALEVEALVDEAGEVEAIIEDTDEAEASSDATEELTGEVDGTAETDAQFEEC